MDNIVQNERAADANAYLALLEQAILNLRMRIRYGENVSLREVHDILDALPELSQIF